MKHFLIKASRPMTALALFICSVIWTHQAISNGVFSAAPFVSNSTLGFGNIYVVSANNSPRKGALYEAAAVTGLSLTIPEQENWSEDQLNAFPRENSTVPIGTKKAWLGHHTAIRSFVASGMETALIIEDDVDWDIRLRIQQIPTVQLMAHSLLSQKNEEPKSSWPETNTWDLLYLGHCGDYFGKISDGVGVGYHHYQDLGNVSHVIAQDSSMLYRTDLHPFTASLFTAFGVPEQARIFHASQLPLCTFGYAITASSARTILALEEGMEQGSEAYDVAIKTACQGGVLRCYTVQPELFHHMVGTSLIAVEQGDEHPFLPPVDEAGHKQAKYRGETSNIGCGFWNGKFYYNGDLERMRSLQTWISDPRTLKRALKEPTCPPPP